MTTTSVNLTQVEYASLSAIARQIGKTEAEVLQEAVHHYIAQFQHANRKQLLQQARGMWRERTDLPDATALRRELDRDQADQ
jgi:predicted transcriptional regulator